jgi:hypothetical protein
MNLTAMKSPVLYPSSLHETHLRETLRTSFHNLRLPQINPARRFGSLVQSLMLSHHAGSASSPSQILKEFSHL